MLQLRAPMMMKGLVAGPDITPPDFGDPSIPTPLHWYDAGAAVYSDDAGTTQAANGERVGSIENYGSEPLNVAPAGNGPILRTGGQNGRSYLDVTAGEYLADLSAVSQPGGILSYNPYTIFIVEKNVRAGANFMVGSPVAGYNKVTVRTDAGISSWYKSNVTYTQIRTEAQLRIYLAGKRGNSAGNFFRGDPVTPYTEVSANNNYSPGSASAQLLRHTADAGNYVGHLYEFIYFSVELTAAQCTAVFDYLAAKYGY